MRSLHPLDILALGKFCASYFGEEERCCFAMTAACVQSQFWSEKDSARPAVRSGFGLRRGSSGSGENWIGAAAAEHFEKKRGHSQSSAPITEWGRWSTTFIGFSKIRVVLWSIAN